MFAQIVTDSHCFNIAILNHMGEEDRRNERRNEMIKGNRKKTCEEQKRDIRRSCRDSSTFFFPFHLNVIGIRQRSSCKNGSRNVCVFLTNENFLVHVCVCQCWTYGSVVDESEYFTKQACNKGERCQKRSIELLLVIFFFKNTTDDGKKESKKKVSTFSSTSVQTSSQNSLEKKVKRCRRIRCRGIYSKCC